MDDEILRSARITARSGVILTVGRAFSTLISLVMMIFVIRFLGEELYGLYRLVLVPISMAMLFRGLGTPSAITRYIAWFKARNRIYELKKIIISGFLFVCLIGAILTVVTYILADAIAMFYRKPETAPLIKVASLTLFFIAIHSASWNVFLGFEDTKYNAAMLVANAIIKGSLSLILVLLGYGAFGAVLGFLAGYFVSAALGIILILKKISMYEDIMDTSLNVNRNFGWKNALGLLLGFGFPLAVVNMISGFGGQFYNFLAGKYCSKWDFGNYGAATTLLAPLPVLALPISAIMFPAYSKIDGAKEKRLLNSVFRLAVKYVSLLIVPLAALTIGLSEPLKVVIFGDRFPDASLYLMLLASIYLYTGIGYLNVDSLLKGQGCTKTIMIAHLIGLTIGIPISFLLIPLFGIKGLIFTKLVIITVLIIFYLIVIKKQLGISIDWKYSVKILLAGIFTSFFTYFLQTQINSYPIVKLLIGGLAGLSVYIITVLITRALTMEDIRNLKVIFGSIRLLKCVLKPHAEKIEEILKKILE